LTEQTLIIRPPGYRGTAVHGRSAGGQRRL